MPITQKITGDCFDLLNVFCWVSKSHMWGLKGVWREEKRIDGYPWWVLFVILTGGNITADLIWCLCRLRLHGLKLSQIIAKNLFKSDIFLTCCFPNNLVYDSVSAHPSWDISIYVNCLPCCTSRKLQVLSDLILLPIPSSEWRRNKT